MTHASRQIHLAGFLIAGPVVHSHAVWRHPRTTRRFTDPKLYTEIADILEKGLFDFLFFADRLAVSDQADGSRETAFRYGSQDSARLDPLPIVSYLAATTRYIGLGVTRSTTYYQPNHIVRSFTTLDHLSGGRGAWNVVTSMNDSEGRIFGQDRHMEHDLRYDRADEFLDVAFKLWRSWEPDALVHDKEAGFFVDPAKIHPVDHRGQFFAVEGPMNMPPGPGGHPVIIQAGASGRGRRFGARWAEAIFAISRSIEDGIDFRDDVRRLAVAQGRAADSIRILTAVMPFIGRTEAEAIALRDAHNALARPELGIVTLSGQLNFDFAPYDLTTPIADLSGDTALPAAVREKLGTLGGPGATLDSVGREWAASVRVPQLAGTGPQIARVLAEWFEAGACDGFVVSPAYLPGSFADFTAEVVPELQRLGLYRHAYTGTTLRHHLSEHGS
ncbi:LLM class flavin-dependent oxidoreductase [Acidisoma cellulosilytica]|uniref:LLM class flavin-dependent oxidoreductase n=1 Tax=Acidisoma cellulosilyticum TaxID=2802395 RepID=A0A963Z5V7_9PROT|nr:LLM class flavin-dependent oxidoreductase [Acidisoma cellulosilyticum]MCB8882605.1 LLM class flavin-dependent oxidoreductase [Acidisoma cellulosilyticum]